MGKNKELITKGRFELKYRGTACLNCGQPLDITDKYCPNCSQLNSTKKVVLKDFINEFLSGLINYDSKLIRTLYTMILKPGTITKDYINGKRIRYTNPFRFLFSLAFLYFLMFTLTNNFKSFNDLKLTEKIEDSDAMNFRFNDEGLVLGDSTGTGEKKIIDFSQIDSVAKEEAQLKKNLQALDTLDSFIQKGIENQRLQDSLLDANPKLYFEQLEDDKKGFTSKMDFFTKMLRRDSISSFANAQEKFGVKNTWKNEYSFNASKSLLRALARPGDWLNDTISRLPFVIFLFLPVFTIFIFLAYIRNNYTYTDHLIFSFHNQSLLFILLILSWVVDTIFGTVSAGLFLTLFSIYLFQAMRKFYGQGVFKTIIKYLFLNSVFTILALITVVMLSIGSVFTY
ncbi:hypothetical protein GCM10011414_23340 [Croceivirga lutea]|uniref:DUF3667 domain-containing protein n=1 Tax=Croceivirga lutea TaxID=1775167 RepID=UPI001639600A|nr:DUF3667 domain-containing protein [Croceivirga lutea]GGG53026.1 hypothetical protein GCM10011414_23340 [Croceivirga lutea]